MAYCQIRLRKNREGCHSSRCSLLHSTGMQRLRSNLPPVSGLNKEAAQSNVLSGMKSAILPPTLPFLRAWRRL